VASALNFFSVIRSLNLCACWGSGVNSMHMRRVINGQNFAMP
jgi:hypothetical protein